MRLRTKILLFYLPLILLSVGAMTLFAQRGVQNIVEQGVAKGGLSVASGAVQNPEMMSGFRERSEPRLLPLLQAILVQTQALHVIALDPAGQVLAHTNVGERGKAYQDPVTVEALQSPDPLSRRTRSVEGQPVMDIVFPIWDRPQMPATDETFLLTGEEEATRQQRLGILRIGLPLHEELQTGDRISRQIFWIITVGSSLVLALILLFTGRVLRPIRLLAEAVERLGRGERGGQVDVRAGDEIGDLARSFNRMSADLTRTTVSKDFLDSILANMHDALLVTTAAGQIRSSNRSVQSLLGYSETALQERRIVDLFALDALDGGTTSFAQLVREDSFQNLRGHAITHTADRVPVLVSASAFADPQSRTEGYIVTAHDITAWLLPTTSPPGSRPRQPGRKPNSSWRHRKPCPSAPTGCAPWARWPPASPTNSTSRWSACAAWPSTSSSAWTETGNSPRKSCASAWSGSSNRPTAWCTSSSTCACSPARPESRISPRCR